MGTLICKDLRKWENRLDSKADIANRLGVQIGGLGPEKRVKHEQREGQGSEVFPVSMR